MDALVCPRCAHIDQVQSAATVYQTGSGVQQGTTTGTSMGMAVGGFGVAPMVMGHRSSTHGTQATHLALAVAPPVPPRKPRRLPSASEIVLFVLFGPFALLVLGSSHADHHARLTGSICGGLLLALPATALLLGERRRRRRRAEFRAYGRVWAHATSAWWEAMVCLRCHVAFFPPGTVGGVPVSRHLIPLPEFGRAVLLAGAQLADVAEMSATAAREALR